MGSHEIRWTCFLSFASIFSTKLQVALVVVYILFILTKTKPKNIIKNISFIYTMLMMCTLISYHSPDRIYVCGVQCNTLQILCHNYILLFSWLRRLALRHHSFFVWYEGITTIYMVSLMQPHRSQLVSFAYHRPNNNVHVIFWIATLLIKPVEMKYPSILVSLTLNPTGMCLKLYLNDDMSGRSSPIAHFVRSVGSRKQGVPFHS